MDPVARVGQPAPEFALPDLHGNVHRLVEGRGRILVLVFWSAECSHSERTDEILAGLRPAWGERVRVWWVAPNPNEGLERLRETARRSGADPVLMDGEQTVAGLYAAAATPHVYVIDADGVLCYAGAPDDVAFRQPDPTRHYLSDAVEALLAGGRPDPAETPPFGCALVRGARPGRPTLRQ